MQKYFILYVLFGILICSDLIGQAVRFNQIYGNVLEFKSLSLTETPDGGYLMAGEMSLSNGYDYVIVKTDSSGNVQWLNSGNRYDGVNNTSTISSIVYLDNYYYLFGGIVVNQAQFDFKAYLVKCDTLGNIVWDKVDSSLSSFGTRIVKSTDGNLLFTGYVVDTIFGIKRNSWYGKIDTSGSLLWSSVIPDTSLIEASDIIESNSKYIVSSNAYRDTGLATIYGSILNCVDSLGYVYWNYSEKDTSANGISNILLDSGYIYIGQFYRHNFYAQNSYNSSIIKLDTLGNFILRNGFSNLLYRGKGASVYVTKTSDHNLFGVCQGLNIVKIDKNGGDIWKTEQDTLFYETQQSILNSKGNLVTTGYITLSGNLQVPFLIEFIDTTLTNISAVLDGVKVSIFPNPFTTGIYVHSSVIENRDGEVYNSVGSLLLRFNINVGLNYIDLSNLSSGVYFLRVVNNHFVSGYKIIKN